MFMAMIGGETNTMFEGTSKKMAFTHHQKYVIMDTPRADGQGRELFAFVGGIDLTLGRWDNRKVSYSIKCRLSQQYKYKHHLFSNFTQQYLLNSPNLC